MGGAPLYYIEHETILAMSQFHAMSKFHCQNVSCRKGPFATSRGLSQHLNKSPVCKEADSRPLTSTSRSRASEQKHNQYNPPEILLGIQDLSTGEDVDDAPFYPPDVENNNDDFDDYEHNNNDYDGEATHTGDTNEPMPDPLLMPPKTFEPRPPNTFDLKNPGGKCPREWVKSWISWSEADSACHPPHR